MADNSDLADRICDRILDEVVKPELKATGEPLPVFAGQLLALHSFMQTMPTNSRPVTLIMVDIAVSLALQDIARLLRSPAPPVN